MTGAGGFDRSGTELYPRSTAGWFEDHVSPDVALGFARYAHATADERFRRDGAWRVLQGVADWIVSRVTRTGRGYELKDVMGIAETQQPIDNNAYTTMISTVVLREAIACARQIGAPWPPIWQEVADHLVLPRGTNTCRLVSHDDFDPSEDKGATPDPLAGIFPVGYGLDPAVERATLDYFLQLAPHYIGSPMLSPLYGAWAARTGDRQRAAQLLETAMLGSLPAGSAKRSSTIRTSSRTNHLPGRSSQTLAPCCLAACMDSLVWRLAPAMQLRGPRVRS